MDERLSGSSAERPHLQLHHAEVGRFCQAAVVERVAGAAAAQIQVLIHPQAEVTAASTDSKTVQVSFNEERVFSGPSETLEARVQHEEKSFSCTVKRLTGSQRVREEGPKNFIECVLYDHQHRRVCGTEFPVKVFEAGAVSGGAVSQLPGVAHRPGGQLLTQLSDM